MAKYVDGFVMVVPKDREEDYKKMAEDGRDTWMRLGALAYYECRGNDLATIEMGGEKAREFPEMTGAKDNENVWFSFIVFKSKEHRDEINKKMHEEMEKDADKYKDFVMPFETSRMAYGGFEVVVEG